MDQIKLAIVGNGGIATWAHMPTWSAMENVEVVALCDIVPEQSARLAKKFNLGNVPCYTDYFEMIKQPDINVVDICTPNKFHSIYAVDALERGKDVFCEKPDAISVEEVLKMEAAYRKSGKTLMVMRNNRFDGKSTFLKKYIEDGNMGRIYAGRCGWQRRRGQPCPGSWFSQKELSGGGPLIDLGVHMIDLSIWLMGNPNPVAVSAATYREIMTDRPPVAPYDVEDLAMGFIRFDNGAVLQIEFSWASNVDEERVYVELRGSKAGAYWGNGLRIYAGEAEGTQFNITPEIYAEHQQHDGCLRHFVDVITKGEKPIFVPEQGVNMIRILRAIYESSETGHEVVL